MDSSSAQLMLVGALALTKPVVETGCRLIEGLLAEPLKVASAMLTDEFYNWQWTNRIRIANRAKFILDEGGIPAKVLPKGFFLNLLDEAGNIEEVDLQEIWSRLLASGMANDAHQHPSYVTVLKQLSRNDAIVLRLLRQVYDEVQVGERAARPLYTTQQASEHLGLAHEAIVECADNLKRLGLLIDDMMWPDHNPPPVKDEVLDISLTKYGFHFTEACIIDPRAPDTTAEPS